MKQFSIFLLAMLFVQQVVAQRYPFQWVNVPNGVSDILNNKYGSVDVGAGYNVYKMAMWDDFEFDNGVYLYKGMGPHFPLKLFIFNDDSLYIFHTPPFKVREYIVEWKSYFNKTNMENEYIIDYSAKILRYLKNMTDDYMDSTLFSDSLLHYIKIITDSKSHESQYLMEQIYSRYENFDSNVLAAKKDYHYLKINKNNLYGQWYFQTIIHKKHNEISQQVCIGIPEINFKLNNEGVYYENSKRNSFYWSCKNSRLQINNIDKIFFNEQNPQLLIKKMFWHNNKLFMELDNNKGSIYVLSRKNI